MKMKQRIAAAAWVALTAAGIPALAQNAPKMAATRETRAAKAGRSLRLEAEDGELVGVTVMKEGAGFSGTGYVGGFEAPGTAVRFHKVPATAGVYQARIRYRAASEKGVELVINGRKISAMMPASGNAFATASAGKVELKAGENEIAIERGWGYYHMDALELAPAPPALPLRPLKPIPVDPAATPEARRLLRFLNEQYGRKMFSGQQNLSDVEFIQKTIGLTPAILSSDLIEYSPSRVAHGSKPAGSTERLIRAAQSGSLLSVMWHWNAPKDLLDKKYTDARGRQIDASWYRGFYTEATTFDVRQAMADPKSEDYRLLLRDIDTIAVELKKIQAAGIPVLWRPLHEAEGGWFWWGAKGPEAFKELWRLLYNRLTQVHGLHNLLWVYTAGGKKAWYPGDSVVDIVGADAYPSDVTDPLSSLWEELLHQYDGRKMLALTEFGGVPDAERMARFGVRWAYFASWGGDLGPKKVTPEELARLYHEKRVVNEHSNRGR